MEEISKILVDSVSGGFWRFCGYWLLISVIVITPVKGLMFIIALPFRHYTLRKFGYPPAHCDADGDLKK